MILSLVFDILKLALTSSLCVASLRFASQLRKIVELTLNRFGGSDLNVRRLYIIYWFVRRLSVAYITGILLCNLLKPIVFMTVNKHAVIEEFTWAKSWFVISDSIYLITVNTQQLLILLFYYRLD